MNSNIKIWTLLLMIILGPSLKAQDSLTLENCYVLSRQNYPLLKQQRLLETIKDYTIENLSKGYLPNLSINGQASYQSEVTELPFKLPNLSVPSLSKDQYKLYMDAYQPILDGKMVKRQQNLVNANTQVEIEKVEVELYKLKERIDQIFFGILLMDAQKLQTQNLIKDLQNTLKKTNAAIVNGTALPSSASLINAEILKIKQRDIELNANRSAFINVLSLLTKTALNESSVFVKPEYIALNDVSGRPELRLYQAQKSSFLAQDQLISAKNSLKLGLFGQAGYGRPAFNFFNNQFDFYYIGGLKLTMNLSSLYTKKAERAILITNQNSIDIQQESFELNNRLILTQQEVEINKFKELILTDKEIIDLRLKVISVAESQLNNGTLSTTDYITNLNALDQAEQNQALHILQLLQAQINQQTTKGK